MYELDFKILLNALPFILQGLYITILISLLSSLLAFLVGSILAYLRTTANEFFKKISTVFVECVRNTPLLIQIFLFYKGLPSFGIELSGLTCGVLALGIYTGVYISEVLRSGINSAPKEQFLSARSLGLSRIKAFIYVIYPQALRTTLPPLASQFINLIKNSSLVSFIAVTDIFFVIYKGSTDEFRVYEYFLLGIVVYMTLTGLVSVLFNLLDKKFKIAGKAQNI